MQKTPNPASGPAASTMLPPVTRRASGLLLWIKTITGRSYPRIIGASRELSWLLFEILLPLIYTCGVVLVYRTFKAPEEYVGFVILGGAMISFWMNVLWSMAAQLYWEKDSGNLALYIASPAPLPGILLGMAIGSIVGTSLRALVILLAGSLIFSVQFYIASPLLLITAFVLCMTALYGLGMVFSSLFLLFGREAQQLVQVLQEPVNFVSGSFFPVKHLGTIGAGLACLLPITVGLDALRQLSFSQGPAIGFLSAEVEILILLGMSLIFVPLSIRLLAYIETLAIRDGRIVEMRR